MFRYTPEPDSAMDDDSDGESLFVPECSGSESDEESDLDERDTSPTPNRMPTKQGGTSHLPLSHPQQVDNARTYTNESRQADAASSTSRDLVALPLNDVDPLTSGGVHVLKEFIQVCCVLLSLLALYNTSSLQIGVHLRNVLDASGVAAAKVNRIYNCVGRIVFNQRGFLSGYQGAYLPF